MDARHNKSQGLYVSKPSRNLVCSTFVVEDVFDDARRHGMFLHGPANTDRDCFYDGQEMMLVPDCRHN